MTDGALSEPPSDRAHLRAADLDHVVQAFEPAKESDLKSRYKARRRVRVLERDNQGLAGQLLAARARVWELVGALIEAREHAAENDRALERERVLEAKNKSLALQLAAALDGFATRRPARSGLRAAPRTVPSFPGSKFLGQNEGEIQIASGSAGGKVLLDFGKPTVWIGMDPDQAIRLAVSMVSNAKRARTQRGIP